MVGNMLLLPCFTFVATTSLFFLPIIESLLRVPILVKTSTLITTGFPTQVVVPLPQGLIFDENLLGLEEVPSQIKVLERWRDDGSLRNIQVLFLAGTTSQTTTFHLVDTGSSFPTLPSPVRVTDDSTSQLITVDSGKVRFTVKKTNFNLFDDVWVDYNADGQYSASEKIVVSNSLNGGVLIDYLNRTQRDSDRFDINVTIEESGPVRAVILAKAPTLFESSQHHTHGFAVRIFAFAGQDYVHVDYQLQNSARVQRAWPLYFHEMNLNLDLNLASSSAAPTLVFGATDGSTTSATSPAFLAQDLHSSYSVKSSGSDGTILKQTNNLTYSDIRLGTGYVHVRDTQKTRSVTVVGRNFWQMWPNGLSVKGKQLSVQLFPSWSAQWEGATSTRPFGRISPTGLYWLKDMQHVYKSILFAFHSTIPSVDYVSSLALNFQYGPVGSVSHDWYAQARATLDLGGYIPPTVAIGADDTVSPDSQFAWSDHFDPNSEGFYHANVRNFGDPEGPYRAYTATTGGWPYESSVFQASGYSSAYYLVELWGIGEMNVRPQWLAGYKYQTDQPTLQLTENPYAGGTWRIFEGFAVSIYAEPLLNNTDAIGPDYGARDDQHGWFYHAMDSYFVTGNPWIKDWYDFIHEFRMVRLHQGDPFPDTSSRALGHSLANAIQASRVTGASDLAPTFRSYLVNYLIPSQDPRYGQQFSSIESRGGSFETGYLMRTIIAYMEEVRRIDPEGYAKAFNYLSGLMAWNLNYGNFPYQFNADNTDGSVGTSDGGGFTLVDPQAWYYWNTGKLEYWNQIVDYMDGGINGGGTPYGDGFRGWGGSFEGRMYQYVLQTPRGQSTPPARISDLVASKDASGRVIAQWTTPARAKRFHLVWSNITISEQQTVVSTKRNWWACAAVGTNLTAIPGSKQTIQFSATITPPAVKFVAMFTFDDNNNMSPMSNVATVSASISPLTPTRTPTVKPTKAPNPSVPVNIPPGLCFSERNTVEVASKGVVPIKNLQVGDAVKSANGNMTIVYSFGHRQMSAKAEYLQIYGEGLVAPLEISKDHLLFVNVNGTAVPASTISLGDMLHLGKEKGVARVTKIRLVVRYGLYAPLTTSGTIMVSGVAASSYVTLQEDMSVLVIGKYKTPLSTQWLSHVFLSPHRLFCRMQMEYCKAETYNKEGISTFVEMPMYVAQWFVRQNGFVMAVLFVPALLLGLLVYTVEVCWWCIIDVKFVVVGWQLPFPSTTTVG